MIDNDIGNETIDTFGRGQSVAARGGAVAKGWRGHVNEMIESRRDADMQTEMITRGK